MTLVIWTETVIKKYHGKGTLQGIDLGLCALCIYVDTSKGDIKTEI
jgi:hypothetical protein